MSGALARAYEGNPDINQQRAALRARDEGVPQAKAGYLPKVSGQGQGGHQGANISNYQGSLAPTSRYASNPNTYGLTLTQTLFDGLRTPNSVLQAESVVLAQREVLRQSETATLQAAATAYMDVQRDAAVLRLRRQNIGLLEMQLKQTEARFRIGEVTRTDLAQAQSALAIAHADFAAAQSALAGSSASYRRVVGVDAKELEPAQAVEKFLPATLAEAIEKGLSDHPAIMGALHQVDAAESAVHVAEAALLPQLGVQGSIQRSNDTSGIPGYNQTNASVMGTLTVPLTQGGSEYSSVRQAKEQLGQSRLAVDSQRIVVRGAVAAAWGQLQGARAAITAYQASVRAAEIALRGVREEAKVGQRTTLDVLNALQSLMNARVQLIGAQHDRVVASYVALAATGRLTAEDVGLGVVAYDPDAHYQMTRNRLIGLSVADGR